MTTRTASEPKLGRPSVARRDLMKIATGAAALSLVSAPIARAGSKTPVDADLFAFRSPDAAMLIFAVAFPAAPGAGQMTSPVRIHAGPRSWSLPSTAASETVSMSVDQARIYVGHTFRAACEGAAPQCLAVVAADPLSLPAEPFGVWAEVGGRGEERLRVGNPMVAELLGQDSALASIFHRALPEHDEALFAEALAERIARNGAVSGALDPRAHGARLAAMLLPDVLPFDPLRPVGFTFAGQNGRRPSDQVADVVATVLAGVVTARAPTRGAFMPVDRFPYFARLRA